jgi:aminoglycoside 6'-N-acetyltransferase
MTTRPTLRGPRVLLRPTRASDAAALERILAEPEVARYWPDFHAERVNDELIAVDDEDAVVFAIEHEGEVIGAIQYGEETDPQYRHAGVDMFLGTRWQGRGLAGEAIRAVLAHLFDDLGHHRAVIDPSADNERAIRAYERVGFHRVGVLRRYERGADGTWHDGLLMDLLAEDLRKGG